MNHEGRGGKAYSAFLKEWTGIVSLSGKEIEHD
jgi:hypothetical protein